MIRDFIGKEVGSEIAKDIRIIYGGEVDSEKAGDLIILEDVDGFLV